MPKEMNRPFTSAPIVNNHGELIDSPGHKNQVSDAISISEMVSQLKRIGLLSQVRMPNDGGRAIELGHEILKDDLLWKTAAYELSKNQEELEANWNVIIQTPGIISYLVKQKIINLQSDVFDKTPEDTFEIAEQTLPFMEYITEPIAKAGIIVNWWKDQLRTATAPYKQNM